jgi:hypothetical protein
MPTVLTLGPWVALVAVSGAAVYGAWRFWRAHALTGCRLSLIAAGVSLLAPLSVLSLVPLGGGSAHVEAGLPAVGAVAAAGFALSRSRRFAPMTVGLWLPSAIAQWRRQESEPLASLLEAVLGQAAAAHASRTAALAAALAEPLSIPPAEADDLVLAALLHAIGTPQAPAAASRCPPGAASRALAANVLRRIPHCQPVATTVAAAGERWDGTGPLGVGGESLSPAARIIAVADAFDCASEGGLAAARAAIREGSGTAFDPVVVSELLHLYRDQPAATA